MRRILKVAAFIMSAAFIMLIFACPQKAEPKPTGPVAVTGVSLNTESLTLPVGTTATLTATVAPSNATEKRVTWASNNETVATVVNGTVTAKALGTATITVTTLDGSKTATCSVTVTNHPLTSISVSPTQTSYTVGDNFDKSDIIVTANYSDGSSQEVTEYTVDVTSFDTVGTTTVTVSYTENNITKTDSYTVTVNPKPVPVTSVSLDQTTLSLTLDGTTATLIATVSPSDATNKAVTWTSSTPSVATVADGTVIAHTVGTATITVKTEDGEKTATCDVTVTNPLTSISVSPKKTVYTIGDSFDKSHITVTAHYSDGSSQEVTNYTASPTTFNTIGTTTVTVSYTEDGITKTANYNVTIEPVRVTSVSLDKTTLSLILGSSPTATLVATVSPSNATNKAVTWESSNRSVATVADGVVTAVAVGSAIITVKTEDGEKTATCNVTVTNPLTSISVSPKKTSYNGGDNFDKSHITVTAHYSDGSSHEVTNYTASPTTFDTDGGKTNVIVITVSYTEDSITKTANYDVTVYGIPTASAGSSDDFVKISVGKMDLGKTGDYHVTITRPFEICTHEVTQSEYEKFCRYSHRTGYNYSYSPSYEYGTGSNHPVYYVAWYDAIVYCNLRSMEEGLDPCYKLGEETDPKKWADVQKDNETEPTKICGPEYVRDSWDSITCDFTKNGYRLPTEVEWEIAARGGVEGECYSGTSVYSELKDYAWYENNSGKKNHEVKTRKPNAYGLYDMSGNVMEWCWDLYNEDIYSGEAIDPVCADSGPTRVVRGGYVSSIITGLRASDRGTSYSPQRSYSRGFRLARTVTE